ncbi:MAG: alpha/beta fold hydrolase [Anaerolineales bacterium]|nr:alpha/beta fold hydrolase [Anaerolineales bacterium]
MKPFNYPFRGETDILNEKTRMGLPGQFTELPDGFVHYELVGPSDSPVVVLVHGFSVPYYIWDPTITALTNAGLRVLRYDLYGRGYSDRPASDYSLDLFNRQLRGLLEKLEITTSIAIAGVSMGGPIAAYFSIQNPGRVRRLCLIDPAGFGEAKSLKASLIMAPLLGEILLDIWGENVLVDGLTDDFFRPDLFPEYREKYLEPMKFRGFKRALLSTIRQGVIEDQVSIYRKIHSLQIPALIFWGKYDKTFPVNITEQVKSILPAAAIHIIDHAGHVPHYEQPEIVNPILTTFFSP